jgi:pullulanase/glycogen debranching enzyme
MRIEDWAAPQQAAIAFVLRADGREASPLGAGVRDDTLLVMMNGEREPIEFAPPAANPARAWRIAIDTREEARVGQAMRAANLFSLEAGGLVVCIEGAIAPELETRRF